MSKFKILPTHFATEAYERQRIIITAPAGSVPEDFLNPNAYSNIALHLNPHDSIEVISEDTAWKMKLFVVEVARMFVRVIQDGDVLDIQAAINSGTETKIDEEICFVKYRGPKLRFCLVRTSDNSNLSEKHQSQEDANKAKNDYLKALNI